MKRKGMFFAVIAVLMATFLSVSVSAAIIDGDQIIVKPGETSVDIILLEWETNHFGNSLLYKAEDPPDYDGVLPEGLELKLLASGGDILMADDSIRLTGTVSSSPSETSGSFTIKLTEHNHLTPQPDIQELTFHWTIHVCEMAIYLDGKPNATVGAAYSATLRPCKPDTSSPWCGSGEPGEVITHLYAIGPYDPDLGHGLPPGLSFNTTTGVISGTPTTTGSYTFFAGMAGEVTAVGVTDPLHSASADGGFVINVAAPSPSRDDDDDDDQVVYYVIDSEAGKGGSIDPEGLTRVYDYGNQAYTIRADEGYVIDRVLVDGKNIGAVSKYEFTRVAAHHTIQAYFVKEAEPTPENVTHNPSTGAPIGASRGVLSLGAALLLIGGTWLLKEKR